MKNFKVIMKTDQENCPHRYVLPYHSRVMYCSATKPPDANNSILCTEKNCPFKERNED